MRIKKLSLEDLSLFYKLINDLITSPYLKQAIELDWYYHICNARLDLTFPVELELYRKKDPINPNPWELTFTINDPLDSVRIYITGDSATACFATLYNNFLFDEKFKIKGLVVNGIYE